MQVLTLPKSQLSLRADELIKTGPDDEIIARFPTDQIKRIGLETTRSYGAALAIIAILAALGIVAHLYIPSPGWSWVAIIACVAGSGAVFMGIEGRVFLIETSSGEARYPIVDMFEEAEGFVLSLNGMLGLAPGTDTQCPESAAADAQPLAAADE